MEIIYSFFIAIAGTLFVAASALGAGDFSKRVIMTTAAVSFVGCFVLSYVLGVPELVLSLI